MGFIEWKYLINNKIDKRKSWSNGPSNETRQISLYYVGESFSQFSEGDIKYLG